MVVLAFYARHLTKTELSLLPIYEMLGGMSTLLFGFGLLPTFVRRLPILIKKDIAKAQSIILTGSTIILTGSVFYSITVFLFAENISKFLLKNVAYSDLVRIMAVSCLVLGLKKIVYHLIWVDSRFRLMSILNMIQAAMNASLSVGLFFLLGIKGVVMGLLISDICFVSGAVSSLRKTIFGSKCAFYPATKLLKESWPFYLESYLTYFRSQGDNWIVTSFLGPTSLAIYYIAKKIYSILSMPLESTDKVMTSNFAKYRNNLTAFQGQLIQSLDLILYIVFPLIFLVIGLSPSAIFVLAGSSYMNAVIPSIILCFAILILFVRIPIGRSVFILMSPKYRFKITIVETCCIVVFLFLFAPLFREAGVALSRLISSIIATIYAYVLLLDTVTIKYSVRGIFNLLLPSFSMAACLLFLQLINFRLIMMPVYVFSAACLFVILTSIFNNDMFYGTLNKLFSFEVIDPVRWLGSILSKRTEK